MSAPTTKPDTADVTDTVRAKTLRGLILARTLDAARIRRGFTTRALATAMAMSPAMLNRTMTGRRVPDRLEIGGLCALLDIPTDHRHTLYRLVMNADLTDWVLYPDDADNPIGDVEKIAAEITHYEPALIPLPLRTDNYHQAITDFTEESPDTESKAARLSLPISRFLIHPQALQHPGLPREVIHEQLLHLRGYLNKIRLLPATTSPHPGFRCLEVENFHPIIHIRNHNIDILLEKTATTTAHTAFLQHAETFSLTTKATYDALRHAIERSSGRHRDRT
ncbi:hypothetical protein UO65_0121 [Actinokineospora spheciospongiae]|uniref:DUF5753 domain-containing protein n=1 Tax=Actinokineospora spheciospongiae TaxID=909613 RepID=W7JEV0_9PSEU|nr:Scr1 family TA system antitoxin-like transcriptional regulator [Actinokineospora spheciospongiae]EWC64514.1 hypothetical protein UO65_0121 [Actinokineospora spheciospongiae]